MTMPFTFTADGGYLPFQRFLKALHARARHAHGRIVVDGRLLTIEGFSLAAGRRGFPSVRALVSATAYLEPDPAGGIAGATARHRPPRGDGPRGGRRRIASGGAMIGRRSSRCAGSSTISSASGCGRSPWGC